MKTHTNNFKNEIKKFGRQLDSKITYMIGNEEVELGTDKLNSITPHYEGALLKSVMKQLDIDSNEDIPLGTEINYQFGVLVGNSYEYLNFGNYIVYSSEKQEDTKSYKIVAYDKMLYSMKSYEDLNITYPITIRSYLNTICTNLGLTFANASDTFANYNKQIPNEMYLDSEGNDLGYTFRDVLDELSQVTAGTICINNNDELEIRYINDTNDTINEEYLKDINVNFGEKYGPINSIVLSRSAESDNVYLQDEDSVEENGLCELKIKDNQIMNGNDRADYLQDILNTLDGTEFYLNDYSSTGVCYYDLCDRYNVSIDGNTYSCVMFNDEVLVTQGLQENVFTERLEESETDYTKADKTDRRLNQTTLIVNKQTQEIEALSEKIVDVSNEVNGFGSIQLENAYEGTLHRLEISGNLQLLFPSNTLYPSNTLKPTSFRLQVDDNIYELDFTKLRYVDSTTYDKYVYEDGKQWVERYDGTKEESDKEVLIEVTWNSTLTLINQPNARLNCEYLLDNEYTDTFTTNVDLISRINLTPGNAEIDARRISLTGKTIDLTSDTIEIKSKYFNVDKDGNMIATSATLSGNLKNYSSENGKLAVEIKNTKMVFYDYKGTGNIVGLIASIRGISDNVPGISLYTIKGSKIQMGYADDEDSSISSIISFDTNNPNDTPWIKNTVSGTLFPNAGGITVQHGLIKDWDLKGAGGLITLESGTVLVFKSGLLTEIR